MIRPDDSSPLRVPADPAAAPASSAAPAAATAAGGLHRTAGETADGYRWTVLAVTSIGALLASLTSGTLVIALPDVLRDLQTDLFTLLWIVVGYTLAATVLVLNAGRIADQVGRARSYTFGFALFTVASVACALAPTALLLVLARLAQGVGGAFLMADVGRARHRRVPAPRARPRARDQRDGRRRRAHPRPDPRRPG